MNRPIRLWDSKRHETRTTDDAGTSIVKSVLPSGVSNPGPYESQGVEHYAYVPSLASLMLKKLFEFPDQVHSLEHVRLRYQGPSSRGSYDLLRELILDYDPNDTNFDLSRVDPRLWATIVQVFSDLPDTFRTYHAALYDKHIPLLQRIPSTPHFCLITILDLSGCLELTDDTIVELKCLSGLSALDASETKLSAYGIKSLSRTLNWSDDDQLTHRERRGPWALRTLALRECKGVDKEIFSCLPKFPLLSVVDLRGTKCNFHAWKASLFRPTTNRSLFHPTPLSTALDILSSAALDTALFSSSETHTLHIRSLEYRSCQPTRHPSLADRILRHSKPSANTQDSYVVLPPSQSFTKVKKDSESSDLPRPAPHRHDIKPRIMVGNSETLARKADARNERERHERNKDAWYERNEGALSRNRAYDDMEVIWMGEDGGHSSGHSPRDYYSDGDGDTTQEEDDDDEDEVYSEIDELEEGSNQMEVDYFRSTMPQASTSVSRTTGTSILSRGFQGTLASATNSSIRSRPNVVNPQTVHLPSPLTMTSSVAGTAGPPRRQVRSKVRPSRWPSLLNRAPSNREAQERTETSARPITSRVNHAAGTLGLPSHRTLSTSTPHLIRETTGHPIAPQIASQPARLDDDILRAVVQQEAQTFASRQTAATFYLPTPEGVASSSQGRRKLLAPLPKRSAPTRRGDEQLMLFREPPPWGVLEELGCNENTGTKGKQRANGHVGTLGHLNSKGAEGMEVLANMLKRRKTIAGSVPLMPMVKTNEPISKNPFRRKNEPQANVESTSSPMIPLAFASPPMAGSSISTPTSKPLKRISTIKIPNFPDETRLERERKGSLGAISKTTAGFESNEQTGKPRSHTITKNGTSSANKPTGSEPISPKRSSKKNSPNSNAKLHISSSKSRKKPADPKTSVKASSRPNKTFDWDRWSGTNK